MVLNSPLKDAAIVEMEDLISAHLLCPLIAILLLLLLLAIPNIRLVYQVYLSFLAVT